MALIMKIGLKREESKAISVINIGTSFVNKRISGDTLGGTATCPLAVINFISLPLSRRGPKICFLLPKERSETKKS